MSRRKEFRVEVKVLSTNLGQVLLNICLSESHKSLWDSSFLIHRNIAKNIVLHKEPGIKETPKKKLLGGESLWALPWDAPHFLQQDPKPKMLRAFGGSSGQFLSRLSSWWKNRREERLGSCHYLCCRSHRNFYCRFYRKTIFSSSPFDLFYLECNSYAIKFSGFKSVLQFIAFLYIHKVVKPSPLIWDSFNF